MPVIRIELDDENDGNRIIILRFLYAKKRVKLPKISRLCHPRDGHKPISRMGRYVCPMVLFQDSKIILGSHGDVAPRWTKRRRASV